MAEAPFGCLNRVRCQRKNIFPTDLAAAAWVCHALSLFGTAPKARVRPNHSSPIDPIRHQRQTSIATECISFPISGNRCRDAFLFLFQAIDAGHLVYIAE